MKKYLLLSLVVLMAMVLLPSEKASAACPAGSTERYGLVQSASISISKEDAIITGPRDAIAVMYETLCTSCGPGKHQPDCDDCCGTGIPTRKFFERTTTLGNSGKILTFGAKKDDTDSGYVDKGEPMTNMDNVRTCVADWDGSGGPYAFDNATVIKYCTPD